MDKILCFSNHDPHSQIISLGNYVNADDNSKKT